MRGEDLLSMLREAGAAWSADHAASMGAALSYYAAFSLAPLLIIVIGLAGVLFGRDAAQTAIFDELATLVGVEGARAAASLLERAPGDSAGLWATVLGAATLLVGATSVFAELQADMDRIWRAPPPPGFGILHFLRTRLLSFGVILALTFLLLVSLLVSAGLAAFARWWGAWFAETQTLLQALNFLVSAAITSVLFAVIYKWLPRVRMAWRDVWGGAVFTALLFSVGKLVLGIYLGRSGVAAGFGAAGSLVVIMVWVYYSAQIFLLGAEFTRVYAHRHGSRQGAPN
ncbi:MAG: YihY/virulence factor BrkB family protein [Gammaproteobacteria bacterium]